MRAIIVCVDFSDFLRLTLPRTMGLFDYVTIVTSGDDTETVETGFRAFSEADDDCAMLSFIATNEFYLNGAPFNKGAALDYAIESHTNEWVCILDADIFLPRQMDLSGIKRGHLYSPQRRMQKEPGPVVPESTWCELPQGPECRNGEYGGYFPLFHAGDIGQPPWYSSPMWRTAQGCDTVFTDQFGPRYCRRLPFEVLHLGETRVNWGGRVSRRWDDYETTE